MLFDPREFEAGLALGEYLTEDLPAIAIDALEAGYDTPALCRLAGLLRPSAWETAPLVERLFTELPLHRLTKRQAALRLGRILALKALEPGEDPLKFTGRFHALYRKSDYQRELVGAAYGDDPLDWDDPVAEPLVREAMRDTLMELVRVADESDTIDK